MHGAANWILQNLWVELALGGAVGFALAVLLFYLERRIQDVSNSHDEEERSANERRQKFLLFCEDAKVITDLAIQRHWNDANFLQRLRAQPCFEALVPHFSDQFQELIAHEPNSHANKAILAAACLEEIARLETTAGSVTLARSGSFGLKNGYSGSGL